MFKEKFICFSVLGLLLWSGSCTLGAPEEEVASEVDAGDDCSVGLPPPSAACLPKCGNELGVGQPCTKGGGECSDFSFSEAALCTVDFDDTDLAFCTRACAADDQCGTDAFCAIDPENPMSGAGCMPNSCKDDEDDNEQDGGP